MNTEQINSILNAHCKNFIGVYSSDALPRLLKANSILIINTDCICKDGEHWLCLWVKRKNHVEVFDSFGMPLRYYPFLKRPGYSYTNSRKQLQSLFTSVCGQYCVCYAIYKQQGGTLKAFANCFGKNRLENDTKVWQLVNELFDLRVALRDPKYNII